MGMCEGLERVPGWAEMRQLPAQWELYQKLVEGVPEGIAVKDVAIGNHWVLVEAESGCGMATAFVPARLSFMNGPLGWLSSSSWLIWAKTIIWPSRIPTSENGSRGPF